MKHVSKHNQDIKQSTTSIVYRKIWQNM